ncbi:MAG TPA: 5'/3'-nucleotidase SurE [Clostridia bacterium]|nr:5'/3'-nucleotidase SurE [Clostridia bacterium]HRU84107.1 5'/3'-nucleotidase SurE [Eubacteriales bacterium]
MLILLTNDDGYFAKGLETLALKLAERHEVKVVAPEEEHSGSGHAMSLHRPLTLERVDFAGGIEAYGVNGSPVDAVRIGLDLVFCDRKPDLIISGINNVLNLGTDIIYSGTFNAAMEGTVLGFPSIAVSTRCKDGDYDFPAEFVLENLDKLMVPAMSRCTVNVNIPHNKRGKNKGVAVTTLGVLTYNDRYEMLEPTYENKRREYLLVGEPLLDYPNSPDCDVLKAWAGYITITPILIHAADADGISELKANFGLRE